MLQPYTEAFLKPFWAVQESFSGGGALFDADMVENMITQGLDVGRCYGEMMDIGVKAMTRGTKEAGQDSFKALGDRFARQCQAFYETAVGKYLRMPRIGLGGKSVQEMMLALDAYYVLMGSLGQFLQEFNVPLVAALNVFQNHLSGESQRQQGAKDVYHAFLNLVDQKYTDYLNSPAGVQRVADLIDRYLEFKQRLDLALEPLLRFYHIPTKQEMDAVYKRIHLLRKQNRELQAQANRQQFLIEEMQQKIGALERAGAGKGPIKAPKSRKTPVGTKRRTDAPAAPRGSVR